MKSFAYFLLIAQIFIVSLSARELSSEELASMKAGLEQWRELVRTFRTLTSDDAIVKLGAGLRKTTRQSIYLLDEREDVRRQIRGALLSIPNHAEYYREEIEKHTILYLKAKARLEQGERNPIENGKQIGMLFNELIHERSLALLTLQELPSVETLRVLGEMLDDERTRVEVLPDKSNWEEDFYMRPASELSALTLREMIENPPATGDFVYERDMPVWRNWWRQVKEGRRTVRFKGDMQDYDRNGPVREARNPDLPRATKRPHIDVGTPSSSGKPSAASQVPWVAASIIAILGCISWIVLKKRKVI